MGKKKRAMVLSAVLVAALAAWVLWANKALTVTEYQVSNPKIPEGFKGFRIVQVSDLHNDCFGEDNSKLLDLLRESCPDMIVITGDLVDSRKTDMAVGLDFARRAQDIAPVYYVPGNHEARLAGYEGFRRELINSGVTVLDNRKISLERSNGRITLMGVNDPHFWHGWPYVEDGELIYEAISQLQESSDGYTILLSHRPDLMAAYAESRVDLVLSGHAHGGQFRIPFLGGLVAPDQGFFPEYDAGCFVRENTTLIVSRGLGASIIPLRLNNRPEVVVVTLNP